MKPADVLVELVINGTTTVADLRHALRDVHGACALRVAG